MGAAVPSRADGVDDPAGLESKAGVTLARPTSQPRGGGKLHELGAGRPMDRAVDAATTEQR